MCSRYILVRPVINLCSISYDRHLNGSICTVGTARIVDKQNVVSMTITFMLP